MAKRKNEENTVDTLPQAKRWRIEHVQPLQESDSHNQLEEPKLDSSKSEDSSAAVASEAASLSSDASQLRRPRTTIYSLPVELLEGILAFHGTFRYGGCNLVVPFPAPYLTDVCQLWDTVVSRRKVITTHQDWQYIDQEDPLPALDYIRDQIVAAQPHTLQLGPLNTTVDEDTMRIPPQLISNCLVPSLVRLVLTSLNARDLEAVTPFAGLFDGLVELVLKLHDDDIGTLQTPIRMFENAPKLERVTVVNAVFAHREGNSTPAQNNLILPWDQIGTYTENLRNYTEECLPSVFYAHSLNNLTTLVITMPVYIDTPALCDKLRNISLPKLESLAIEAAPALQGEIPGFELLDYMALPSLKNLALAGHKLDFEDKTWKARDPEGQKFIAALLSYDHLESLSLSYPRIPDQTLRKVLDAVKGIKKLDVHITASKEDYKIVFEELTVKDGANTLLPLLESFSFDVANGKRRFPVDYVRLSSENLFDLDSFSSFVNSRRGPDLSSGISHIRTVDMFTDWEEGRKDPPSFDLGLPYGVLTIRHILDSEEEYGYLKGNWQQFRFLERFSALDDAFEAKQFLSSV